MLLLSITLLFRFLFCRPLSFFSLFSFFYNSLLHHHILTLFFFSFSNLKTAGMSIYFCAVAKFRALHDVNASIPHRGCSSLFSCDCSLMIILPNVHYSVLCTMASSLNPVLCTMVYVVIVVYYSRRVYYYSSLIVCFYCAMMITLQNNG